MEVGDVQQQLTGLPNAFTVEMLAQTPRALSLPRLPQGHVHFRLSPLSASPPPHQLPRHGTVSEVTFGEKTSGRKLENPPMCSERSESVSMREAALEMGVDRTARVGGGSCRSRISRRALREVCVGVYGSQVSKKTDYS